MSILIENSDEVVSLRLEGEVDIAVAAELKARLVEVLDAGKEIRVDLMDTADLDVTALQLLHVAHRDSIQSGSRFVFENVSAHIAASIADAGFVQF